jgi:hypothetical protein
MFGKKARETTAESMQHPSLRATGSRECASDDRLREAIQFRCGKGWIASSLRSSQ